MSFIQTNGEYSSFPGSYGVSGNTPYPAPNTPWVISPATNGKAPFGSVPPEIRTRTTGVQLEPYAPSIFPTIADQQGRVMAIQPGDLIFNIHPKDNKEGLHIGKALWDLNYGLSSAHAEWQSHMKTLSDPGLIYSVAKAGKKRKAYMDLIEQLERKNVQTLNRFKSEIYYVGVSTDPGMSHITKADSLSLKSGVRTLVINNNGRVQMPNVFGDNLEMGTPVGILIKKNTNPTAFMKDHVSWPEIVENLAPLEVIPVVGMESPGGAHGGHYVSYLVDHDKTEYKDQSIRPRLPGPMRNIQFHERDPWKVDCDYYDYEIDVSEKEDGTVTFHPRLVMKTGMYIHIGRIYKPIPSSPMIAEIRCAVNPYGQEKGSLAQEWIRLLSEFPIEIFVDDPGTGYFM